MKINNHVCVFYIYISRNSCCPLQNVEALKSIIPENLQNTIVREGTVEVPASPKQDTEAGTISHKHLTSPILEL